MAALFQQLRHVLAVWDTVEGIERPRVVDQGRKWDGGKHKTLFMSSVNTGKDGSSIIGSGSVVKDDGAGTVVWAEENYPQWLAEMEQHDRNGRNNVNNDVSDGAQTTVLDAVGSTGASVDSGFTRRRITRLELARAALALFTSNAGMYRPILQKTLGFIFGLIDELLEESVDVSKGDAVGRNALPLWSPTENEEVAAAHERMRMMELRMAKLVEEAATQRDHLKAEITASQAREAKLESLLKHQIILSHAGGMIEDTSLLNNTGQTDALYVKRLIARAEKEKAIDDLQRELTTTQQERDELGRRVQELLDLNGKYAHQCVELAARLSILTDHNIVMAISCEKYQNEVLVEKRRAEKHLQDLQVARNVVVAAFMNRQCAVQSWWESFHEKRLGNAEETFLHVLKSHCVDNFLLQDDAKEDVKKKKKKNTEESNSDNKPEEKDSPHTSGEAVIHKGVNVLCHLWIPRVGCNPETPEHLRSTTGVEYLSVNPIVVERVVHIILSEWRKDEERCSLDNFTCNYLQKVCKNNNGSSFSFLPAVSKESISLNDKFLSITYALDAVSRSGSCGSLTYAFGLVSRGRVNKNIFRMLEFDNIVILALCRFLDIERNLPNEPRGFIPVVQFAGILVAMYPSYSPLRLQQLLNAARNDSGNRAQSPLLIYYSVLLPERMFLDSESNTVDNNGALWDTGFVHLLYKFICDDVEDSLQTIEDWFYASAIVRRCGVASESQLLFQAFDSMSDEDRHLWFPAIRVILTSWSELRADKASVVLEDIPRVSVHAAVKYLRSELLLRRGTRIKSSETHSEFLFGLQQQWNKYVGGHDRLNVEYYVRLINYIDEKRNAVWGSASSSPSDDCFRHLSLLEGVTLNSLLEKLLKNKELKI